MERKVYSGQFPFVKLLLPLLAGILMGNLFETTPQLYSFLFSMLLILLATVVVISIIGRRYKIRHVSVSSIVFFSLLGIGGWLLYSVPFPQLNEKHFSHYQADALVGIVEDEPVFRGAHSRFSLRIIQAVRGDTLMDMNGKMMVTVRVDSLQPVEWKYGDELVIPADFNPVPPPYNPGEMDYRKFLIGRDIWHQAYFVQNEVNKVSEGQANALVSYALLARKRLIDKFARYITEKDALSVVSTLILGYRADLSQELLQAYSATGTIHVLSVSGMHVVLVFWVFSKLLWWMDRSRYLKYLRYGLLLFLIWSYALVTGFSPPVLRASIMITFVMTALQFGYLNRVLNSIAASAFFLLLYNPKFAFDIGFQLSYVAVIGIVLIVPLLQSLWVVRNSFVKPIWDYALMSVAAQTGAGPLAAYYFHQFPLYFLPANLFIVLPASGIMYLGFLFMIWPEWLNSSWIAKLLEWLTLFTNQSLRYMEQLPMASIQGIWWDGGQYFLIYLMVVGLLLSFYLRRKAGVYLLLACFLFQGSWVLMETIRSLGRRELVIFNVRKHLAIAYLEHKKVYLYSDLESLEDKVLQYSVMPKLTSRASKDDIYIVSQSSSSVDSSVYVGDSVILFGGKTIFIYEEDFIFQEPMEVDILMIRRNPQTPLREIGEYLSCKLLLLDATNYDSTIERYQKEAKNLDMEFYILKNNFAYECFLD